MSIIALTTSGENPSIVTSASDFDINGHAILIRDLDTTQIPPRQGDCNMSYDLRVGTRYRDHRDREPRTLTEKRHIKIAPRSAVIIRTREAVHFPKNMFGHIVPKVKLLQDGIANTPTKIDPGYNGHLLITTFNHGRASVELDLNQPFCSMFVSSATGDIVPYDKDGKDLEGDRRPGFFTLARDFLDQNYKLVQVAHWLITAALAGLLLFK